MDSGAVETGRRLGEALREADLFSMGESGVQKAARAVAKRLGDMGIDYAVAGALALAAHGHMRLTTDVDILIAPGDLSRFKSAWLGRGYVEVFPGSRSIRDADTGVRIDFILSGDFPGDGKPKPVAFPLPADASLDAPEFRILKLGRLMELKLASGMTAPHRLQDLADVIALVRVRRLARELGDTLHPYVRQKYEEMWEAAQHAIDDEE